MSKKGSDRYEYGQNHSRAQFHETASGRDHHQSRSRNYSKEPRDRDCSRRDRSRSRSRDREDRGNAHKRFEASARQHDEIFQPSLEEIMANVTAPPQRKGTFEAGRPEKRRPLGPNISTPSSSEPEKQRTAKPRMPMETEEDKRRMANRMKNIAYGKNTRGYERYLRLHPKKERGSNFQEYPRTPDPYDPCSRRSWDGRIKAWRTALHKFDPPETEEDLELSALLGATTSLAPRGTEDGTKKEGRQEVKETTGEDAPSEGREDNEDEDEDEDEDEEEEDDVL